LRWADVLAPRVGQRYLDNLAQFRIPAFGYHHLEKRRSAASKTPGPLQMGDIGVTPTKEERNRLMTGSDRQ
jgi:hypothetical protein